MAIHRTYLVRMPSNAGTMPYLDILVEGVSGLTYPIASISTTGVPIPVGGPAHAIIGPGLALTGQNVRGPSNWQVFGAVNGDGAFLEWRGRPIKFDNHFYTVTTSGNIVTAGFVPRMNLGWKTTIVQAANNECPSIPAVAYSKSLLLPSAWFTAPSTIDVSGLAAIISGTTIIDDPTYNGVFSPVVRLFNNPDIQGSPDPTVVGPGCFYVHLDIYEMKDEDRNPGGIG